MGSEQQSEATQSLLTSDEAPAHYVVNASATSQCLVICDHASNRMPSALDSLGVPPPHLEEHIAWDIGAEQIARALAELLGASLVASGYSRLVVDLNRYPEDPNAFPEISDNIRIPGNSGLAADQRERRFKALHVPYHTAISDALDKIESADQVPVLVSVHTMTQQMRGETARAEQVSVLRREGSGLSSLVLQELRRHPTLTVGDNTPYDLEVGVDFSVPEHAMRRGIPYLMIEVRQDLARDSVSTRQWAELLCGAIIEALKDPAAISKCEKLRTEALGFRPQATKDLSFSDLN